MALNAKLKIYGGSKSLKYGERERKRERENGSKCHNCEKTADLNAEMRRNDEGKYAPMWCVATTRSTEIV